MSDSVERELFRIHREVQNRYTYFLLTAAAAALGFSLTQTQGLPLLKSQMLLLFAALSWGLSFFCGCKQLRHVTGGLYDNGQLLKVESGRHPLSKNDPQLKQMGSNFFREKFEKTSDLVARYSIWQFRLFILGSVLYMCWHVWEMWLRTSQ